VWCRVCSIAGFAICFALLGPPATSARSKLLQSIIGHEIARIAEFLTSDALEVA